VSLVDRAIRVGIRRGWSRGVGEGQRVWLILGGVAVVARLAGRALRRDSEVVFSEKIRPGESFVVTHEARS
jgi:hypothetical protein